MWQQLLRMWGLVAAAVLTRYVGPLWGWQQEATACRLDGAGLWRHLWLAEWRRKATRGGTKWLSSIPAVQCVVMTHNMCRIVNSALQGAYRSAVMLHVPNAQDIDNLSLYCC